MLNNIMNSISVSGDQRTMDEMLKAINSYDDPFEIIDFNTVIPMPESLMIESNCITSRGLQAYKDFIYVYTLAGTRKDADLENIPEESEKVFLKARQDVSSRQWELGKAAYANLNKYGVPTWYEWAVKNRGTSSNACCSSVSERNGDTVEMRFQTAWTAPHPILERLSEMYPSLVFDHAWADKNVRANCGRREYRGGRLSHEYYPNGDDAAGFANKVWRREPDADEAEEAAETEETENPGLKM